MSDFRTLRRGSGFIGVLGGALLLAGCGSSGPPSLPESTARKSAAIHSGSPSSSHRRDALTAAIRYQPKWILSETCSATLVTNQLAITAAHCTHLEDKNRVRLSYNNFGSIDQEGRRLVASEHDGFLASQPGSDLRLVHVWPPVQGERVAFVMPDFKPLGQSDDQHYSGNFRLVGYGPTEVGGKSGARNFGGFQSIARRPDGSYFGAWSSADPGAHGGLGGDSGGSLFTLFTNPIDPSLKLRTLLGVIASFDTGSAEGTTINVADITTGAAHNNRDRLITWAPGNRSVPLRIK